MSEHTPGPWTIHWTGRHVTSGHAPSVRHGDTPTVRAANHYICQMWRNENGLPYMEANARLIAAAPEMLEVIGWLLPLAKAYLQHAPSHPDNAKLETARALVARIEGKRMHTKSGSGCDSPLRPDYSTTIALCPYCTARFEEREEEQIKAEVKKHILRYHPKQGWGS